MKKWFSPQHPHGAWQPSIFPVIAGTVHAHGVHSTLQTKHSHKLYKSLKYV